MLSRITSSPTSLPPIISSPIIYNLVFHHLVSDDFTSYPYQVFFPSFYFSSCYFPHLVFQPLFPFKLDAVKKYGQLGAVVSQSWGSCIPIRIPLCGYPPGTCEDDADARGKRRDLNMTGFKVTSARGSGQCTCSDPFHGQGCELGFCPPGQRLDRHVTRTSNKKYEQWQVCVPCESGRFKNFSGNSDECSLCPPGQIPQNGTHCIPCPSGNIRSPNHPEKCVPCVAGDVALAGAPRCTPCQAGTEPNEDGSACVACPAGGYAKPTVCNQQVFKLLVISVYIVILGGM